MSPPKGKPAVKGREVPWHFVCEPCADTEGKLRHFRHDGLRPYEGTRCCFCGGPALEAIEVQHPAMKGCDCG